MSKVAAYLQEHIQGEVSVDSSLRQAFSHDASILTIQPEIIVYPRLTSDIRKVARFAWQLAEKGHILPITARGHGSDETGAAIGNGVVVSLPAHMNQLLEVDTKQRLVRLQPGMNAASLQDALRLRGLWLPCLPRSANYSTAGGAIANNVAGAAGSFGTIRAYTQQLEVVLASGDILQTGRLNKRDLAKKRAEQTFEGEIYRNIDDLVTTNQALINERIDERDQAGYAAIAQVKRRDGSLDLTPLFVGSQGTLGIVSEMILRTEFVREHHASAVLAFESAEAARDSIDTLEQLKPSYLEYFAGELFEQAAAGGKQYPIITTAGSPRAAVIIVGFDEFNDHALSKHLKKIDKLFKGSGAAMQTATGDEVNALQAVRRVTHYNLFPAAAYSSAPPLLGDAYIPRQRLEDFMGAVQSLAATHNVSLPLYGDALRGIYSTRPIFELRKVTDKQKMLKLLDEYAALVERHSGHFIGANGEGRLKTPFTAKTLDADVTELYKTIKTIFDPHGILNPGVKQGTDLKQLITQLRPDYDLSQFADFAPYN